MDPKRSLADDTKRFDELYLSSLGVNTFPIDTLGSIRMCDTPASHRKKK